MDTVSKAMLRAQLTDISVPKSPNMEDHDELDSNTRIKLKNAEKERKKEKKKREKQHEKKEEGRQKMRQSIREKYDLDNRKSNIGGGALHGGRNFAENAEQIASQKDSCALM